VCDRCIILQPTALFTYTADRTMALTKTLWRRCASGLLKRSKWTAASISDSANFWGECCFLPIVLLPIPQTTNCTFCWSGQWNQSIPSGILAFLLRMKATNLRRHHLYLPCWPINLFPSCESLPKITTAPFSPLSPHYHLARPSLSPHCFPHRPSPYPARIIVLRL